MVGSTWVEVSALDRIPPGGARTVRPDGKQIVLFRGPGDAIDAIDNRCPHEGYPLSQGARKDGVLTCAWHNWKFRLSDGVCVMGGEDVRRYPSRVAEGKVWLDLADPPPEHQLPALERGIAAGFDEEDWGRVARDVERMLALGRSPEQVLAFGCEWAARHARYGFDHGLAAAADYAALFPVFGDEAHQPLLESLHLLVAPHVRRPERTFPEAEAVAAPDDAPGWRSLGEELRRRIEQEERDGAEAFVRGVVASGASPGSVFDWLTTAATDHFLSYGHEHIYCVKAEELLERIGWQHADPVLTALVTDIVTATREDTLPYMRAYGRAMASYEERLPGWVRAATSSGPWAATGFVATVLDGSLEDALGAVATALGEGIRPDRIALALALAASQRLQRFDPEIARDEALSEGWLHVTHLLTHADAVRESLRRRPSAETVRGLFQSARFIQHAQVLDLPVGARVAVPTAAGDGELDEAIHAADPGRGARVAARLVAEGPQVLEGALLRSCVRARLSLPVFVAHHVKTVHAAVRIARASRADQALDAGIPRSMPLHATVRFLCHPIRERNMAVRARVARAFVREGKLRESLLGY